MARYADEPPERRRGPATHYDWSKARRSEPGARGEDAALMERIRRALGRDEAR